MQVMETVKCFVEGPTGSDRGSLKALLLSCLTRYTFSPPPWWAESLTGDRQGVKWGSCLYSCLQSPL
jgi:hypothetical protein